jgi:hypothetical protein
LCGCNHKTQKPAKKKKTQKLETTQIAEKKNLIPCCRIINNAQAIALQEQLRCKNICDAKESMT